MIQFVAESGGSDRVLSHFESWEADSGDKYSFDIMEESSFEGRKDFGGFVEIASGEGGNAYFKPSSTSAEPEYEIQFSMQANGLVREYEINYGDFSIMANLKSVEAVESASCS